MSQPSPSEVAARLLELYDGTSPRKKAKDLRITKAQFNALAGRQKIVDSIRTPIVRKLRKRKLHLIRLGNVFAILDDGTVKKWDEPDQKFVRKIALKKGTPVSPQAA